MPAANEPMKSQQRCVAVFALLCCLAVLLALIFSAVDVWGDEEDGITEDNCSRDCRIVVVETIPEDLALPTDGATHVPLVSGLHSLLDRARSSVEMVSPVWDLTSGGQDSGFSPDKQGKLLFQRLINLKPRGVKLKIASSLTNNEELITLADHDAEVGFVNTSVLTRGGLHASFWIVDRRHVYVGSAGMDWRALSKRKELGVVVYNCSCLALDLHRVFSFYWQLQHRDYIPSIWSRRVTALYGRDRPLPLSLNRSEATAYLSASPEIFCPKDRTRDVDAIRHVIQDAASFIYISVTDYLPLMSRSFRGASVTRYWSVIDEVIREALVLRGVRVRMLISFWKGTDPLTFNFAASLESLCAGLADCSLEVRFFSRRQQMDDVHGGLNHNKYVVTDSAVYIGNHDWVGKEFAYNAGAGLVIRPTQGAVDRGPGVLEQVKAVFERDWGSPYARAPSNRPAGKGHSGLQ